MRRYNNLKNKKYNYFEALQKLYACIIDISKTSNTKSVNYDNILNKSNFILQDIKKQLYKDFITPIDREDIFELAVLLQAQVDNMIHLNCVISSISFSKLDVNYYKILEKLGSTEKNIYSILKEFENFKKSTSIESFFKKQLSIFSEIQNLRNSLTYLNNTAYSPNVLLEIIRQQTLERVLFNIIDTYKAIVFTIEKIILKNL